MLPTSTTLKRPEPDKQKQGVYASVEHLLQLRYLGKDAKLDRRKRSSAIAEGDSKTHFRGRGMEFAEVRPYQAGDDVRNIDWRVTARTMQPYTKLFQEERERPVLVVVDQRSSMFFGSQHVFKSFAAAELAAAIAWIAQQNNDRIGALIFGDREQSDLRVKRGKHAVLNIINQLHQFNRQLNNPNQASATTLSEILLDLRRVARPGTAVFIISDFNDFDSAGEEALSILARHTDITLLKCFDTLETALPTDKDLTISDGEHRLTINAGADDFIQSFQHAYERQQIFLARSSVNAGARLIAIDCAIDIAEHINNLFGERKSKVSRR